MTIAVVVAAGLLAYGAVSDLVIGDAYYTVRNLVAAGLLLFVAWGRQLSLESLGMSPDRFVVGVRWGTGAVLLLALVVAVATGLADHVPAVETLMSDRRADLEEAALLHHGLIRIPLGTALFEELAFRGVLLALFLAVMSPVQAVLWSSVLFGLWHISSTMVTLRINEVIVTSPPGLSAIVGAVLLTTLAGVAFCLLRFLSGSLVAPILAHWGANALWLLASASFQRTGGATGV